MLASTGALPFKSPFKRWGKRKGGKGGKVGQQQQQSGSSRRSTGKRDKVQCEMRVGFEQGLVVRADGMLRFGTSYCCCYLYDEMIMFVGCGLFEQESSLMHVSRITSAVYVCR